MKRIPELLAPAGHVESFHAAVESGADAVYLGLKQLSARASATNFTLEDLAYLLPYAHKRNVSIYVALNSLVAAVEFPGILDLLQSLSDLKVDALIVQDAGIFHLARKYFPSLELHASTLMTAHNSPGVNRLAQMGAKRVVLARELSLSEIEAICANTEAKLEVFVHGALCYSYSGLCLASSFRGGRSGLRGQCVQPCRLRYRQGRKVGFHLSCNDLCALPLFPQLKKLRLAGFKIEGRMKPAEYVAVVVEAYRRVLDAKPEEEKDAVAAAMEQLSEAPSRRLTSGYFTGKSDTEVLSPHRSGSSGLWVGTVKRIQGERIAVVLRHETSIGDRLRPESSEAKEEPAFTVTGMFTHAGKSIDSARAGDTVLLPVRGSISIGARLIRVGRKTAAASNIWDKIKKGMSGPVLAQRKFPRVESAATDLPDAGRVSSSTEERVILKVGGPRDFSSAVQSAAHMVVLTATKRNLEWAAKQRFSAAHVRRFAWSLPAIVDEGKDVEYYRAAVSWYLKKGFLSWEINNYGNFDFFEGGKKTTLIAGHRMNVRNAAALAEMAELGCSMSVLSMEITYEELAQIIRGPLPCVPAIAVYARPALFTSRLLPDLSEDKPFFTPKGEAYFVRKTGRRSFIYADRPVNWFEKLPALRALGYRYMLIDLSEGPEGKTAGPERLLNLYRRGVPEKPYSLFNFDRRP